MIGMGRAVLRTGWICGLGLLWASLGWGATLKFASPSYRVGETQRGVSVTLVVSAPDCGNLQIEEGTVTVRSVEASPASAQAGQDFNARTYTVPLGGVGNSPITRVLENLLRDDSQAEGDETFRLVLEAAPSQVTCSGNQTEPLTIDPAGATVTIADDEPPLTTQRVQFERGSLTVDEGGAVDIAVVRDHTEGSVAVDVTLTAEAGTVTPLSRTVTFSADSGRQSFQVQSVNDSIVVDETVRLELSNPRVVSGDVLVELGSTSSAELKIVNDDEPEVPSNHVDPKVDLDRRVRPGQKFTLQVKASNANGPLTGVEVVWDIVGPALLDGDKKSTTGDDGIASNVVIVNANAPAREAVKVTATVEGTQQPAEFSFVVEPLDASQPAESGAASVGKAIGALCRSAQADEKLCGYFNALSPTQQDEALEELDGDELGGTETLALGGVGDQMKNLGARLAALRGGASSQPAQHLAIQIQGKPVSPGTIVAVIAARDSSAALKAAVDRELASLDDPENPQNPEETDQDTEMAQPDIQALPRLGVFLSGRVSFGEQDDRSALGGEAGFELDTRGLTAGVDYRLTNSVFLGAAAGLLSTSSDLSHDGGALDARGGSLSVFGLFQPGRSLYLQGALTYGRSDYDMTRNLDLPVIGRKTARADTRGTQLAAGFDVGSDRHWRAHTFSGVVRTSYVRAEIDGYSERGADPFDIEVTAQEVESLQSELGLEWAYTGQLSWGLLQPVLRVSYLHEFEADARLIRGRFLVDPDLSHYFSIPTNEPDRDFFSGGFTLMAQTLHGSIFLSFDQELGRSDVTTGTVTLGIRKDF